MNVDLQGLSASDWLLKTAVESDGQIKYYVHGKVAVVIGNQQVEVYDDAERSFWFEIIRDLEIDGDIVLLRKRIGILTFKLITHD